jgi:hypothetical protein
MTAVKVNELCDSGHFCATAVTRQSVTTQKYFAFNDLE